MPPRAVWSVPRGRHPQQVLHRSRVPISPQPELGADCARTGEAPPSSVILMFNRSPVESSRAWASAAECLVTFVSVSWMMRYAATSVPGGSGHGSPPVETATSSPAAWKVVASSGTDRMRAAESFGARTSADRRRRGRTARFKLIRHLRRRPSAPQGHAQVSPAPRLPSAASFGSVLRAVTQPGHR